jgi:penicillin-binding protein-related factor A (putative recombinase)
MNAGKVFEKQIQASFPLSVYCLRLPDPAQSFGGENQLRFSNKNPYDFLLFWSPYMFALELKSTQGASFSIQSNKTEKGKDVKLHQIEGLNKVSTYDNAYGGFIFNFRNNNNNTYWMSILNFNEYLSQTTKKSINENDIKQYNGILIGNKLKITTYSYYINILLDDIVK